MKLTGTKQSDTVANDESHGHHVREIEKKLTKDLKFGVPGEDF